MEGGDLSIIRLIVQASLVVQIVIGILLAASLTSWAIIFRKRMVVGRAQHDAERFEASFWSGGDTQARVPADGGLHRPCPGCQCRPIPLLPQYKRITTLLPRIDRGR